MNRLLKLEHPHGIGFLNLCWQRGSGGYLATTGIDNTVAIFNRNGKLIERITLHGMCVDFGWDRDGDLLAVISLNSSALILWDSNTHRKNQLDCGLRDPLSCVLWSKNGQTIAITTTRGNVCIYNHTTSRRIPVLGKHSKSITCGKWSSENLLALGSEDRTISISNIEGDTLKIIQLRAEPTIIDFSEMKLDERCPGENTVSVIVGKRTLFLFNLQDPENPVELAFHNRYGNIVAYQWYGDGYILIGFSEGFLISISTHIKEIGQELFQSKNHKERLTDIAVSTLVGRVASCGDNNIKIHEIGSLPETLAVANADEEAVEQLAWSEDGQLLAAATSRGSVFIFLSKLPALACARDQYACVLTSLSQITIYPLATSKANSDGSLTLETEIEPSFLCIGPFHLAVGMNNRIWFYELNVNDLDEGSTMKLPGLLCDREYLGNVSDVKLNSDYASVLFEGKIHLHQIDPGSSGTDNENEMKIFPNESENFKITSHSLTPDFLIFSTSTGHVIFFCLNEWKVAVDYKHSEVIKSVYPNSEGVRCIFIDVKNHGYLYNPVNDAIIMIPKFPSSADGALWEVMHPDRHVFVSYDSKTIYTHVYLRDSINGPDVQLVGETKLPNSNVPLLLKQGELISETPSGKLSYTLLSTHQLSTTLVKKDQSLSLEDSMYKYLALLRYTEAWNLCRVVDSKECWLKLATTALKNLNIDKAIDVYSYLEDVGTVMLLKSFRYLEDKKLVSGHVCKIMGDFDKAQELYLESDSPEEALHMRQDLLQWDLALQLATTLAPEQVPYISREYGLQMELIGKYNEALVYFEKGLQDVDKRRQKHILACYAGIARCAIRCGDYSRGLKIARGSTSTKQLLNECADLFEHVKKLNEAAVLYEEAENYNKAASCFIRMKNWSKVGAILSEVTSSKIHSQYAKAMEAIGNYKKAANGYELARDYDNVIRILLDRLNDPQDAVRIVQDTRSIEGAKMIAKHFQKTGDFVSAVRFLIMSACYEDAYKLAKDHNQLELYGDLLVDETNDEDVQKEFLSLATYFESVSNVLLAGKYYYHAKQYKKAVKYLLAAAKDNPDNDDALSLAIDVVAASNDDNLTAQVIELLLGEVDGEPRDPKFVFRLYMAKREYREAAKTAIIIAQEEQINGNYRQAHDILFSMCCELKSNGLKVSTEMMSSLALLHSYILVRMHVKRGDHEKAAILLVRVADNISKFPAHAVPILTSAVIECHRAGMKLSAFTFASLLMKAEYRQQIDDRYKKKIENIIRKAPKGDQLLDDIRLESTPCPRCDKPLLCTQLNCNNCQSTIPFCIATGWHITKVNLTCCPNCNFPALHSELLEMLDTFDCCPMCNESITRTNLLPVTDADHILNT